MRTSSASVCSNMKKTWRWYGSDRETRTPQALFTILNANSCTDTMVPRWGMLGSWISCMTREKISDWRKLRRVSLKRLGKLVTTVAVKFSSLYSNIRGNYHTCYSIFFQNPKPQLINHHHHMLILLNFFLSRLCPTNYIVTICIFVDNLKLI